MSSLSSISATEGPLSLLGGDLHFAKGVQVNLTVNEEEVLKSIPRRDLLSAAVEESQIAIVGKVGDKRGTLIVFDFFAKDQNYLTDFLNLFF